MSKLDAFILLTLCLTLALILTSCASPARLYPEPPPFDFEELGYCKIPCPDSGPAICYKKIGGVCQPVAIK